MPEIFFQKRGSGRPLILLHGFPMNQLMWDDFASDLSKDFQVFTPDLPGLGRSAGLSQPFSIDQVARQLLLWMKEEGIANSVVIGHSLGGYVALAMVEQQPAAFAGLGLFHSTAYADAAEKKESRTKTADFVRKNGALAFTSNFTAQLFADPGHPAIPNVREISIQASADAVIGYTLAMRDRTDRTNVLKSFPNPILLIAGTLDQGIPLVSVEAQAALCQHPDLHILSEVAHMGMFERPAQTVSIVKNFVDRCI